MNQVNAAKTSSPILLHRETSRWEHGCHQRSLYPVIQNPNHDLPREWYLRDRRKIASRMSLFESTHWSTGACDIVDRILNPFTFVTYREVPNASEFSTNLGELCSCEGHTPRLCDRPASEPRNFHLSSSCGKCLAKIVVIRAEQGVVEGSPETSYIPDDFLLMLVRCRWWVRILLDAFLYITDYV